MKRALLILGCLVACALPGAAQVQLPTFGKSFGPDTIGPGSVSTLTFDISNPGASGADSLAFTDTLPAGVTIASPANADSSCSGSVSAPDGGATIELSGGQLGPGEACSVSVDVTSSTPGTHTNTSGDLTSSLGNSGPATAELTVATDRPGVGKSFTPSAVIFGGRSTLTLTIDNSANASAVAALALTDVLPSGMVIASPSNRATTCPVTTLSAPAGGNVISISGTLLDSLAAGATCTVTVDVRGNAVGVLGNTTGELTSSPVPFGTTVSSGKAAATLTVSSDPILVSKEFVGDPVAPGGSVGLRFTVRNLDRGFQATDIAFTDDLDAVLSGLAAIDTPLLDPCGSGSSLTGTDLLSLTGGRIDSEGVCTFQVTLAVPAGAAVGAYPNTTGAASATINGSPVAGSTASDVLFVSPVPLLGKTFLGDPAGGGSPIDLEFTVTNTSASSSISSIAFVDELTTFLPFPISATLPADPCGSGSSISIVSLGTNRQGLSLVGGTLAAGASCTFTVTLDLPEGLPARVYENVTEEITAVLDASGETLVGDPASDDLQVVAPPQLFKQFTDDPVQPGGTVSLQFTLTFDGDNDGVSDFDVLGATTDITFTDNLDAVLSGLVATGLPASDVCGVGSQLTGPSVLTLTGGSLTPDANDVSSLSCTFSVTLQVPAGALPGSYPNTTSSVTATVLDAATVGGPASDDLRIAGLQLSKEFLDDPVIAGGQVTLRFIVDNLSPTEDATDIAFSDDLDNVLDGLVGAGLPLNDVCGGGSQLSGAAGNTLLVLAGGSLAAGNSCSFDVTLDVPAGADDDTHVNTTSNLVATVGGQPDVVFDPAVDSLTISSSLLVLAKEFIDDPVAPGGQATLRFTIDNLSAGETITAIAFTDDLEAALSGLAASGLPANDVCGAGSSISGTSLLSFAGGSLGPGASCSFDVTLAVPAGAALGSTAANTTSDVTGEVGGLGVSGDPASDTLEINGLEFAKGFSGPVEPGDTVTLEFAIGNPSGTPVGGLEFLDDLDATLSGLTAIDTPLLDPCGAGSSLTGTTVLELSGGNLPPGGDCMFTVTLQVPATATPGDYPNETTELRQIGGGFDTVAAPPATATLTVIEPVDSDGDGVLDGADLCPDTVIPEGVPTLELGVNRHALVDDDLVFDTTPPPGGGNGPRVTFTTSDTFGCSCEQIIAALGLGRGHVKFGCSKSALEEWIALNGGSLLAPPPDGRGVGEAGDEPRATESASGPVLKLEIEGPGSVSSQPWVQRAGGDRAISCHGVGRGCRARFEAGTEVKLMARPDGEARFVGWSGDCFGEEPITTVTVHFRTVCTATFEEPERP